MGILAIGEYIKHWKRNVFVVIQISVLLLVLCVSVTMLATIFRAYKPVQHMADKKGIYVACGEGVLLLSQVQLEGKKRMEADVFLRGCHIEAGNRFMDKKE